MSLHLAENIRAFRKERALTQEQLAEVLGVTVGAVYKWESQLSTPELGLIVEMADFFDTSVDVLLGYTMKENRLENTIERLKTAMHTRDTQGILEAEKALKKFPNHFDVAYQSAILYRNFGMEKQDKVLLRRALELMEDSRRLLAQNRDPKIDEQTLYGEIAGIYLTLDEDEKAIRLLREHNSGGRYSDHIGLVLATGGGSPEEAEKFLSEAFLQALCSLVRVIVGELNLFLGREDYRSAEDILHWGLGMLSGLKEGGQTCFLDKVNAAFLSVLAACQINTGRCEEGRDSLRRAKKLAEEFDRSPNYDTKRIRFVSSGTVGSAYDDIGKTAKEAVEKNVYSMENSALITMWEEVLSHEA